MKLDIILRTHDGGYVHQCGVERPVKSDVVLRCAASVVSSINMCFDFIDITLTVIDDHSKQQTLVNLQKILDKCKYPHKLIPLQGRGNNASWTESWRTARDSDADFVYCIEDDYIHELCAIEQLVKSHVIFSTNLGGSNVALWPGDDADCHKAGKGPCFVVPGSDRLWRSNTETTGTVFTTPTVIRTFYATFENLSMNYGVVSGVNEHTTINALWRSHVPLFSPLVPLAYHLTGDEHPVFSHNKLWERYGEVVETLLEGEDPLNGSSLPLQTRTPSQNDNQYAIQVSTDLAAALGEKFLQQGMNDVSSGFLSKALAADPNCRTTARKYSESLYIGAMNHLGSGNLTDAELFLRRILSLGVYAKDIRADLSRVLFASGISLFSNGRINESEIALREAISLYDGYPELNMFLNVNVMKSSELNLDDDGLFDALDKHTSLDTIEDTYKKEIIIQRIFGMKRAGRIHVENKDIHKLYHELSNIIYMRGIMFLKEGYTRISINTMIRATTINPSIRNIKKILGTLMYNLSVEMFNANNLAEIESVLWDCVRLNFKSEGVETILKHVSLLKAL